MSRLASMVAIVTGSAAGIGRASAIRLAKDGASVVVADLNPVGSDETVAMIESAGGTAISVPTDIGEPDQILALIDRTVERFGTLDILHNNAADTSSQGVGRDKDLLAHRHPVRKGWDPVQCDITRSHPDHRLARQSHTGCRQPGQAVGEHPGNRPRRARRHRRCGGLPRLF